jgi:uncharacterized oxidoreductase
MNTTNNTIFISGGSAGIGLAMAKRFSEAGNKVIINGRNAKRLKDALAQLNNATAIQGDLSLETDRIRIANELTTEHPDLNVVINNAGAAFVYALNETANATEKAMQEMNTNYFSIVHFNELLLPHLLKKSNAAIVNVSSRVALMAYKGLPTYSASKAALHSYTQSLRETYRDNDNLDIYEVYPPLVNTEFSRKIGGANGISPSEVADELFWALEKNQFEVPVGQSKQIHQLVEEALAKLN